MPEASGTPGTTPVTDRRPVPRGALPRGAQAWLMAAIATGMVAVIFFAGRPEPARVPTMPPAPAQEVANPERVREYQDRLRLLEGRVGQEAQTPPATERIPPRPIFDARTAPPEDPATAERKRREYESLFATNVVLSRRPDSDRAAAGTVARGSVSQTGPGDTQAPSIDDIADAVVRASVRAGAASQGASPLSNAQAVPASPSATAKVTDPSSPERRARTSPISAAGPMHRLLEGTLIDTVLTNRLDGGSAGPVNCLVTNAVYSHSGQQVLIPAGARLLGETKPVQSLGETRLAVAFHRLVMPDGSTYVLDDFLGANQIGDAGLRDRVNHHYWSTFGVAGAVGLISGLAQYIGTLGLARGDGDRTLVIAGSTSDATSQASLQVMNRFLNRMPTITIREGHRIKVYLTADFDLPAYDERPGAGQS